MSFPNYTLYTDFSRNYWAFTVDMIHLYNTVIDDPDVTKNELMEDILELMRKWSVADIKNIEKSHEKNDRHFCKASTLHPVSVHGQMELRCADCCDVESCKDSRCNHSQNS